MLAQSGVCRCSKPFEAGVDFNPRAFGQAGDAGTGRSQSICPSVHLVFGIAVSLDGFGTGYSSLNYLKRLSLDQLKIDQSFVRDMLTDAHAAAIARTSVTLGQSLELRVNPQ